jgi:hypothetical protein
MNMNINTDAARSSHTLNSPESSTTTTLLATRLREGSASSQDLEQAAQLVERLTTEPAKQRYVPLLELCFGTLAMIPAIFLGAAASPAIGGAALLAALGMGSQVLKIISDEASRQE